MVVVVVRFLSSSSSSSVPHINNTNPMTISYTISTWRWIYTHRQPAKRVNPQEKLAGFKNTQQRVIHKELYTLYELFFSFSFMKIYLSRTLMSSLRLLYVCCSGKPRLWCSGGVGGCRPPVGIGSLPLRRPPTVLSRPPIHCDISRDSAREPQRVPHSLLISN